MDLSILLPLSNHLELTRDCLGSLERTTRGMRWEVILIDDGTTDGTREFLHGLKTTRHRAIFHEEGAPRGAAACINAAARLARAPLLCTLSPAAVLLPGWIQPMLRLVRRLPCVGCVGSVHREPISGLIDHTGILFDVRGRAGDAGRSTVAPPVEPFTRWPAVSASCCVLEQRLHVRLGGLDEDMPLEWAGIDFCLRAAETTGARHYTANSSVIYVHRGDPEKAVPGGPREAKEIQGQRRFEECWGARARAYQLWEQAQLAAEQEEAARNGLSQHGAHAGNADHWEDMCRSRERLWHRRWEIAREKRRQWRQDIYDGREDGWRYLLKHAWRPWRYNWERLSQALVKVSQPRPVAITKPPRYPRARHAMLTNGSDEPSLGHPDALLFNPPAD